MLCSVGVYFLRVCLIVSTQEGTVTLKAAHGMLHWGWWGWPLVLDGRREAGDLNSTAALSDEINFQKAAYFADFFPRAFLEMWHCVTQP